MLFLVKLTLFVRFFTRFNAPRPFTWVVGFLFANATLALIAVCADTWKLLIIYRSSMPPMKHSWQLPVMKICDVIAATIEQCFLLHRYYGFSRAILPTGLIVFLIPAHVVFGFKSAIELLVHPEFGHPSNNRSTTVAFALGATIDILIPIVLIWELRKIKTNHSHVQSIIHRLIVNAASSGFCVAFAEILLLILFRARPELMPFAATALGPLYGITILVNTFARKQERAPDPSQTKTANLTTLDSFQLQQSINPPSAHEPKQDPFNPQ